MSAASSAQERDAIYAGCIRAALDLGAPVAMHIAAASGDLMLRRAAATGNMEDRRLLREAAKLLGEQREAFRTALPALLQREFARLEREEAEKSSALSFGALELMGEAQVDETVEAMRSQQMVMSEVEADLGHLNALICAARGRNTVTAAANPLRPEAWVHALRAACEQGRVPAWARTRWLSSMSEVLGPELGSVYRQLCELLTRQGISAASFIVNVPTPARSSAARPDGPAAPPVSARPAPTAAPAVPAAVAAQTRRPDATTGGTPVLNLHDLRRLLVGDGGGAAAAAASRARHPGSAADASQETAGLTMPWAFEAMQQMTRMDEIVERVAQRLSSGANRQPGQQAPLTPAQVLGQEVVRVMLDKMAGDPRLLPQVSHALRQLEPALLRLARNDPRFFRDQQHPTRRFLTEMTERSLAWRAPDSPGFDQFFEPVRQAVSALAELRMDNAEPFEYALQSLLEHWDQQDASSRRARANAARALIKAERRNLLARRIGERMRQRKEVIAAAPDLRRFLVGPWAQVMAAAQLADPTGASDPGGYAAAVEDLLRSTRLTADPEQRARAAKAIPGLVGTVRGGLASIEYPEDDTRRFLQKLAQLQRQAMQRADAPAAPRVAAEPDDERDPSELWLEPTEARASSLMEIAPAVGPQDASGMPADTMGQARRAHQPLPVERLQEGVWVDLYLDNSWARWRLVWASPQQLLFMFADGGGRYKSMTRSVLETLNRVGALRFVSPERIVEGALDAVAEVALRNSTHAPPWETGTGR